MKTYCAIAIDKLVVTEGGFKGIRYLSLVVVVSVALCTVYLV